MNLSSRFQGWPRSYLPSRVQDRLRCSPNQMSNNHYRYGLLRVPSGSQENSTSCLPEYLTNSHREESSMASTSNLSQCGFSDVSALLKQVENLYMNDQFSDVTLLIENQRFPSHRVILACRSVYFRAMFFGGMKEQSANEVVLHDIPLEAFKVLLRYIYTGRISFLNLKFEVILDSLVLAHKFGFSDVEQALCEFIKHSLDHTNVTSVFAVAHFYSLNDLVNTSLEFIDRCASKVISTDAFLQLSGQSLYTIFSRDSFCVPELEIFNIVFKWIQHNPNDTEIQKCLLECVRLPLIKIKDLLGVVRPTGLIDSERLLDTINDQTNKRSTELTNRGCKLLNTNVATLQMKAVVIDGEHPDNLLRNDFSSQRIDIDKCTYHELTDSERKTIVVELGMSYILNYIELYLLDLDQRAYSYFIEVSVNQQDWIRIIDHTKYLCRSRQQLFFPPRVVKFIKIVGTRASIGRALYLRAIKTMFTNNSFNIDPDTTLLKPTQNVTAIENGAIVIEGVSRSRNALINGDYENYDWDVGYTCHQIHSGSIIIQLPQPYLVDSIRLLLWDRDDRTYSFTIDVSSDQQFWTPIIIAHELRSWQTLYFHMIPVVFIRITGTFNTANEVFHIVHFECPAKPAVGPSPDAKADYRDELPVIYGVRNLSLILETANGNEEPAQENAIQIAE